MCNFGSSIDRQIRFSVWCIILMASQLLFDIWGLVAYGLAWIFGQQVHLAVSWVGSGQLFGGLGWVDENRPMHNCGLYQQSDAGCTMSEANTLTIPTTFQCTSNSQTSSCVKWKVSRHINEHSYVPPPETKFLATLPILSTILKTNNASWRSAKTQHRHAENHARSTESSSSDLNTRKITD